MRRLVVIGDVHGCLSELERLLELVRVQGEDRLVFLGDLIDRGPDPLGVVRLVRQLGAEMVLGNHCEKALRWLRAEDRRRATGEPNLVRQPPPERQREWEALTAEDRTWIAGLPITIQHDNWLLVHAGIEPGVMRERQKMDHMVRLRYVDARGKHVPLAEDSLTQPENTAFWTERWAGPENVIYGHVVHSLETPRIDVRPNGARCIGIDTGCVFGGRLTAAVVHSDNEIDYVSIPARTAYWQQGVR